MHSIRPRGPISVEHKSIRQLNARRLLVQMVLCHAAMQLCAMAHIFIHILLIKVSRIAISILHSLISFSYFLKKNSKNKIRIIYRNILKLPLNRLIFVEERVFHLRIYDTRMIVLTTIQQKTSPLISPFHLLSPSNSKYCESILFERSY